MIFKYRKENYDTLITNVHVATKRKFDSCYYVGEKKLETYRPIFLFFVGRHSKAGSSFRLI
jgi:hypothetical protein